MDNPFLIGDKIFLRAFEMDDCKMTALSENHPDPRESLYYNRPTSLDVQAERWLQKSKDHNTVVFVIVLKEHNQAIGITSLERIDWVGRMATFYIAIAEKKYWSAGFGSEVTRLMVEYAFTTLNLNRIQLHVCVENERAVKLYKKQGFILEGTLRQAMYHHNRYSDFHLMAILKKDWNCRYNGKKRD